MKKTFKILFLFFTLASLPGWSYAQALIQDLTINPAILCSGNPVTITFQAALPGNSTGGEDIALIGAFSTTTTVGGTSNLFIYTPPAPPPVTLTYNTTTETFNGPTTLASSNNTWFEVNPPFSNFYTYTAITTVPTYANGTVIYVTVGAADIFYTTGYTMAVSVQAAVTVDCTQSDAINTGNGVFVNAGVTYTGASNPVTLLINNSCSSPTFTNTATMTFTKTPTSTFTNTFTPTISNTFTSTDTNTFTPTVTNTDTNTFTKTYTSTFTNTVTATFTPTFTNTLLYTATFTSTLTNTFTPTFTDTFMNSPTFTNTFTVTPTNTVTNTPTASPTPTNTFTITPTFTYTNTFVNSPTFTNTFTNSPTLTFTNTLVNTATFTNTDTSTPTMTFTNTLVNTATFTNTATETVTHTPTYTFTVTPTFTTNVSIGKTVSETLANAGDVLTYNIAVTVTGNSLTNSVITDNLPPNMTFQNFVSFPSGAVTQYNAAADQLQWSFASPLLPNVYNFVYQTKVNTFAPANVPLTNNAQLTYAGLVNPWKASVPVTVIGNFSVGINIYNSAGEIVKTIPIQNFSTAINNITLSTTNTITTLTGPGSTIDILFDGYVIGVWNGTNNAGQPVSNGSYQVQVDNVGTTGTVTTVSQTAIVNRSLSNVEVDIFNAAGEVVRQLYNVVANSTTSNMTNVTLSSTVLQPNINNVQNASSSSLLQILVENSNQPVTLTWDGTNNAGTYVTPGQYQIEVHWINGNGTTTDITRTIMVLANTGVSGIAVAEPNILNAANGMSTTFNAAGVVNASSLKVKIYTIAGELVQSITSATTTAPWNASGRASGIYIACVEIDNAGGGVVNNQRLKLLILH